MSTRETSCKEVGWVHYSGIDGNGVVSLRVSWEVLDVLTRVQCNNIIHI